MQYATASTYPQPVAPAKPPAMHDHAQKLQDLAERLNRENGRLLSFLDRVAPEPESAGKVAQDRPAPSGALLVAQFSAERISIELDRMNAALSRLESIG